MKRQLKPLAFLLAAVLLTGAGTGALAEWRDGLTEESNNFFVHPDPGYEALTRRVMETARKNSFNGSVLIATDDEIILFGSPRTKTTEGLPADPFTVYEIGSVTKTFTAAVMMKLIEQGKVRADDRLTRFSPGFEKGKEITVADLLRMESGLIDYVNDPLRFYGLTPQELIGMIDDDSALTDELFLSRLFALEPEFAPGEKYEYSNTNYHLLAMIIEQTEGTSYADAVRRYIFEPCGMDHSSSMTAGDETSVPDPETGYYLFQKGSRGAGDIHSCPADLLAFDRALFGGSLLGEGSLALMKEWAPGRYGFGLYPYGKRAYGHSGAVSSYRTENVVIDSEAFGRVYLIAVTSAMAGFYGLETITQEVIGALGAR